MNDANTPSPSAISQARSYATDVESAFTIVTALLALAKTRPESLADTRIKYAELSKVTKDLEQSGISLAVLSNVIHTQITATWMEDVPSEAERLTVSKRLMEQQAESENARANKSKKLKIKQEVIDTESDHEEVQYEDLPSRTTTTCHAPTTMIRREVIKIESDDELMDEAQGMLAIFNTL